MAAAKKISIASLQQFVAKHKSTAEYELVSKSGKLHKPVFRYRCRAMDETVYGTGRSKKDAKQAVASLMLKQLSSRGYLVPPEFANPDGINNLMLQAGMPDRSYVVLLTELCEQYHLDIVEYTVMAKTVPPEPVSFTVRAQLGHVQRFATAATKRMGYQLAAEQIYRHLRTNLSGITRNFDEEEAMYRAFERVLALDDDEEEELQRQREIEMEKELPKPSSKKSKKKKRSKGSQGAAGVVQETARLELGSADLSPRSLTGVGSSSLEEDPQGGTTSAAMLFIERTMERLGL